MPALPQRHAYIMLCHFPPNPGCFFFFFPPLTLTITTAATPNAA
jgi:hypothetical protein